MKIHSMWNFQFKLFCTLVPSFYIFRLVENDVQPKSLGKRIQKRNSLDMIQPIIMPFISEDFTTTVRFKIDLLSWFHVPIFSRLPVIIKI